MVASLPVIVLLIFVAKRKPYVCGDNQRPVINLVVTVLILFIVLISNLLPGVGVMQICAPIAICLLLMLQLGFNIYYLVIELK
jgi:hypothetical protein